MTKVLTPTPESVDFGTVKIGDSKTVDVVLESTGSAGPTVTAGTVTGHADFSGGAADETEYPVQVDLGKIWTVTDTDLPPRRSFGCVKAGSWIYVVGGRRDDTETIFNDCWRSQDGISWTRMSAACFDKGRSDLALFEHEGKLYAVGGLVDGVATDEIWVSENTGYTWTKSTAVFPQKCARMGYAQTTGGFGIYGGIDETGTYSDKFSRGATPLSWSQDDAQAPGARVDCALVWTDTWLLLCGYDGTDLIDDCWVHSGGSFSDTGGQPFGGNGRAGVAAGGTAAILFAHGGIDDMVERGAFEGQATMKYSTDDGANWATFGTTKTGRAYHAMQEISGKIALIAGEGWAS